MSCCYIPLKKNSKACTDQYGIHKYKDLPYGFCSKHLSMLQKMKPESVITVTKKIEDSLRSVQVEPKIEKKVKIVPPKKVQTPSISNSSESSDEESDPPSDLESEAPPSEEEEESLPKKSISVKQKALLDKIADIQDEDPLALDTTEPVKKSKKGKVEEPQEDLDPPTEDEDEASETAKGPGFASKHFIHYGAIQLLGLCEMVLESQLNLPVTGTSEDLDKMEEFHTALDEALDEASSEFLETFESPFARLASLILFAGANRVLFNKAGRPPATQIRVEEIPK